jgi:hypothetical protein
MYMIPEKIINPTNSKTGMFSRGTSKVNLGDIKLIKAKDVASKKQTAMNPMNDDMYFG